MPDPRIAPPQELTQGQERTLARFRAGMQRAHPELHPEAIRALIAKWRDMGEGQSYLMAATFEKCANDLEELLK